MTQGAEPCGCALAGRPIGGLAGSGRARSERFLGSGDAGESTALNAFEICLSESPDAPGCLKVRLPQAALTRTSSTPSSPRRVAAIGAASLEFLITAGMRSRVLPETWWQTVNKRLSAS
ncbi:hypothetical protein G3446_11470 [Thiorhodococcus minor]|uniref:Uncharacterized protein n=1 Tax=Thiorhodococcus minor TaxID=57489 RepID=A0A6M0K0Q5_9GAMM|nr:hypothetical protein [Thiorhodococcus minor]NEV62503.1 hypothetical protein [Thiorhodococcus minor]